MRRRWRNLFLHNSGENCGDAFETMTSKRVFFNSGFLRSTSKKNYELLFGPWWIIPKFFTLFSSDIFLSKINTICCSHTLWFNLFYVVLLYYFTVFNVSFVCSENMITISACPFVYLNTYVRDRDRDIKWVSQKYSSLINTRQEIRVVLINDLSGSKSSAFIR